MRGGVMRRGFGDEKLDPRGKKGLRCASAGTRKPTFGMPSMETASSRSSGFPHCDPLASNADCNCLTSQAVADVSGS